ncbi:MAG: c-type cytochrome [Bryobacteraceae bacterium]|nr:c-type cytochrome [Bryobacteraceae bacterium]
MLTWILLLAQVGPPDFSKSNLMKDPASVEAGRRLFASACSGCHGPGGEGGRGPNLMSGRQVRRSDDATLFNSVKNGLPGTDMPPTKLPDEQVWQLIAFLRALNAPAYEVIVSGNEAAGREIFLGKGGCMKCHAVSGQGGSLGPDLTNLGGSRPLNQIREAVLEPNKRLAEGYQPAVLHLKSGKTLTGVLRDYTNYTFTLVDNAGSLYLLRDSEVADRQITQKSPMPSYQDKLTKQEQQDLIKYLSRLSARSTE